LHGKILQEGIYMPPSGYEVCFLSAAHTDELLAQAAEILGQAIQREAHTWA
jgi:glutamate-1-semialdehyde 2,1-aminomutase